jgi:hypothetical protein
MPRKNNKNSIQPDSSPAESKKVLEARPSLTNTKKYSDVFLGVLVILGLLLSVGTPVPWNGARLLVAVFVFFFAGYSLLPAHALKPRQLPIAFAQSSLVLLLSFGAGLAAAFVCWFLSAYLFKNFLLGTICTLLFAALGIFRIRRNPGILMGFFRSPTAVAVSLFSLALGCYIYGAIEVQVGDHFAYSFRWDLPLHMFDAALVRDSGLPMINSTGSGMSDYHLMTHVGYSVFVAGVEDLTRTSLFQAARFLGIFSFWLISVAGLSLACRLTKSQFGAGLAASGTLIWGGVLLPFAIHARNIDAMLDPYTHGFFGSGMASGTMYHNGTQLVAVLTLALGLVALDAYCRIRNLQYLSWAVLLFVVSGLTKPSTIIVIAPALLLVMAIKRENWRAWAIVAGLFGLGLIAHMLPKILIDNLPDMPSSWATKWGNLLEPEKVLAKLAALGVGWIVVAIGIVEFVRNIAKPREWNWYDVVIFALMGGAVFSMVFTEVGRELHGNQNWSFTSMTIPLVSLLIARLWMIFSSQVPAWKESLWFRPVRTTIMLMLITQLVGGLLYAIHYPTISPLKVPVERVKVVEQARQLTVPATRFLVDPILRGSPLMSYLSRPALWVYKPGGFQQVTNQRRVWLRISKRESVPNTDVFLASRDAVILGRNTFFLRERLERLGWNGRSLGDNYELWLKSSSYLAESK